MIGMPSSDSRNHIPQICVLSVSFPILIPNGGHIGIETNITFTPHCGLFMQGYLDEQLIHLEELQDEANPNFVEEVATLFYRDSARLLVSIEQSM